MFDSIVLFVHLNSQVSKEIMYFSYTYCVLTLICLATHRITPISSTVYPDIRSDMAVLVLFVELHSN